jgi:hypothetical protein
MPMYRVGLARNETKSPSYDWLQTVSAPNPATAVAWAYDNWVASKPAPPAPPLSLCRTMVKPSMMATPLLAAAATDPSVTQMQQSFIDNIQSQVGKLLAAKLDGPFNTVMYPAGFNYGITYGVNAYYNQATLQDIDTMLGYADNGQLDLTGSSFSNLYAQLLQGVAFVFSSKDAGTINDQDNQATAQVASILKAFTDAGGTFSSPLPLGGKLQDVFNQLSKTYGSVDKLPDTLNQLRNAIASYKSKAGASYALHSRYYAATARLQAALDHVTNPNADNGGMQVDSSTFCVGYTPNKLPTANQLIGELNAPGSEVAVEINVSNFSSNSSQLSISGGTSFKIPIADLLGIKVGASASYDMSRYASQGSSVSMKMVYPGVTLFSAFPSVLSTDNSTGWYANDILQDVVKNAGQDATGYQLQGSEFDVSDEFGVGKAFSRLKTFVISQQPTITMTFNASNAKQITSDLQVNASVKMDLFGFIPLGHAEGSYAVQKVDESSQDGSVTVTFGPPKPTGTIPLEQQVAYVLGGVASYPPNSI